MTDITLRQQIPTLAYEVTESDDVAKQIADLFEPFVDRETKKAYEQGEISSFEHMKNLANMCLKARLEATDSLNSDGVRANTQVQRELAQSELTEEK